MVGPGAVERREFPAWPGQSGPRAPFSPAVLAKADDVTEHRGLVRRVYTVARFPPPAEGPIFSTQVHAAMYLGAWGLTAVHIILWLIITVGLVTSQALLIGTSIISFAATCLLVWMVIAIHQRFEVHHGGRARHAVTVWWRGPWDPVGRLIWLPVRLADAWQVLRDGPDAPLEPGSR